MVKRPFLATFEKILSPIHSTKGNYIITSYTHAHYKNANIEIFKSSPYISKALNIKGLEGTIHPKANISVPVLYLHNNQTTETSYVFEGEIKETDFEVTIENNLKFGSEFIELNQDNIAKNYVTNTIIMILRSFELENDSEKIKLKINQIIDNKDVIDKFKKINSVDWKFYVSIFT